MDDPLRVVDVFNDAFARHDTATVAALLAADCRLHTAGPAPHGVLIEGGPACADYWGRIAGDESVTFEAERVDACASFVAVQWRCVARDKRVVQRGVNLLTVRGRQIVEVHGYVKSGPAV